jgi:hypothetical protein
LARLAAPYREQHGNVADPLDALVQQVTANPSSGESQAIAALLAALAHPEAPAEFTPTRLAAFNGPTLALLAGTIELCIEGTYSLQDCAIAADLIRTPHPAPKL